MKLRILIVALLALASTTAAYATASTIPFLSVLQYTGDISRAGAVKVPEGAPPGTSMQFPAVLVYGKLGCFAGMFPAANAANLSSKCLEGPAAKLKAPEAIARHIDPAQGAVILLLPSTSGTACKVCGPARTAAKAFARDKHAGHKFVEIIVTFPNK